MNNVKKLRVGRKFSGLSLAAATGCLLLLAGCADNRSSPSYNHTPDGMSVAERPDNDDPLEGYNRFMFKVNDSVDRAVIEPVARGYRDYVPQPVRMSVRNFLRNLRTPVNAGNNLLQGDVRGVATDLSRFVINTMIGVGGLFDVAKDTGLAYKPEDFGQTLGVWGVGQGPYLVLPLLGPSTVRDTAGLLVDSYADPVRLYLYNVHEQGWYYARSGASGLDKREELLGAIDDLRRHSFDFYAATRSAYFQERAAMVLNQKPGQFSASAPAIPDYDETSPASSSSPPQKPAKRHGNKYKEGAGGQKP